MQDYIMRLIQQVAQMLAAILGHRQGGRDEEAAREIEQACLRTVGVPMSLLREASSEAMRDFLQSGGPQRDTRDILLAELLLQDAELGEKAGRAEQALRCRAHAFCLIMDVVERLPADDAAVYRAKVQTLAERLEDADTEPFVRGKLEEWSRRPAPSSAAA